MTTSPIIIVGAGLAGLWTALSCASQLGDKQKILVINATRLGSGAASAWAQGGIAAAFDAGDSPSLHLADTMAAGAGLSCLEAATLLTHAIQGEIKKLGNLGVAFDRNADGFLLSREAGHSRRRIVRSAGDMAGKTIMRGIRQAALAHQQIEIAENTLLGRLALDAGGRVAGVFVRKTDAPATQDWQLLRGSAVVLATGGVGQLYENTTNPPQALGYGLGAAALAGAALRDAAFVQFHPTALALGLSPAPLATEALRGEGALLVDHQRARFMVATHSDAELAPRDIVARAVAAAVERGGAFLDATTITSVDLDQHFPLICEICRGQGLDPKRDLIPITPAAHYHMGGVACDIHGASGLEGLWVCGESAANGAHGANRLAGNSLAEALVFGKVIAENITLMDYEPTQHTLTETAGAADTLPQLKKLIETYVGVLRHEKGLLQALEKITALEEKNKGCVLNENMLAAAKMITGAALVRKESRGAHFRLDYPETDATQNKSAQLTWAQVNAMVKS